MSGSVPLQLGFGLPVSGSWATPAIMRDIAQQAEQAGYASLWTFQRLLHPVEGEWGPTYHSVADPLVSLGYAAALTERIRLGVAIVNAPFYSPILLAKQLATLDLVSGGRLDAGLGLGWAHEEFAAAGVPYERRGARTEEFIHCLTAIWADNPVAFDGEFYHVPPSRVDPKPVQRPHPPILLGGGAAQALRRVGRLADGWITSSRQDLASVESDVATIRRAAREAGRDPDLLRVIVRGVIDLAEVTGDDNAGRRPLHGTAQQIRDDLDRLHDKGVSEVFFDLNFHPAVGSPAVNADESLRFARLVLETFRTK